MKNIFKMILVIIGLIIVAVVFYNPTLQKREITSFDDCVEAGFPVMESYPRQCRADGETFVEDVVLDDLPMEKIMIESPKEGETISSPLEIIGEARGTWFWEATFPVTLTDWDGLIIAEGYAEAQDEWMTESFVPFKATLEFTEPADIGEFSNRGSLILHKANASGLPEHDDALEITVYFR